MTELEKKLEWSGRSRGPGSGPMCSGGDGALSRSCGVCHGIDPSDPYVGSWIDEAVGHKRECAYFDG